MPWADGMLLEDYFDAVLFQFGGIPRPQKWCDELREQAAADSFRMLM